MRVETERSFAWAHLGAGAERSVALTALMQRNINQPVLFCHRARLRAGSGSTRANRDVWIGSIGRSEPDRHSRCISPSHYSRLATAQTAVSCPRALTWHARALAAAAAGGNSSIRPRLTESERGGDRRGLLAINLPQFWGG
jgi:hypothetical protein